MSASVDGLLAMDQAGKVKLELVLIARRVRTLHLAELTLEARGDDAIDVAAVNALDVPAVLPVEKIEQGREAVAVLEAQATAVAEVEGPFDLAAEQRRVPVPRLFGIVAEPFGRPKGGRLVW
jgi:hypothetical protein